MEDISRAYHLVASAGATILVPSHPCHLAAAKLKISTKRWNEMLLNSQCVKTTVILSNGWQSGMPHFHKTPRKYRGHFWPLSY